MLLRHSLGLEEEAQAVERAIDAAITGGARTGDMLAYGGNGARPAGAATLSTREMGAAVRAALV